MDIGLSWAWPEATNFEFELKPSSLLEIFYFFGLTNT